MRVASWSLLLASLAVLLGLVHWQGAPALAALVAHAGWALAAVVLFWIPQTVLGALAWWTLFEPGERPPVRRVCLATWAGTAVNALAPLSSVGGTVVKARVLILGGVPATAAAASAVVDKTMQAVAVVAWTALGLALLLIVAPRPGAPVPAPIPWWAGLLAVAALGGGIAIFIHLQLRGSLAPLALLVSRRLADRARGEGLVASAAALDAVLKRLYVSRGRLAVSVGLRLAVRATLLGEIVYASALLGQGIGWAEALIIRAVVAALDAIFFVVPGGLGAQEAGFVGAGLVLGLPADLMLVLALSARFRMMAPSLPGLLIWPRAESQHGRTRA